MRNIFANYQKSFYAYDLCEKKKREGGNFYF